MKSSEHFNYEKIDDKNFLTEQTSSQNWEESTIKIGDDDLLEFQDNEDDNMLSVADCSDNEKHDNNDEDDLSTKGLDNHSLIEMKGYSRQNSEESGATPDKGVNGKNYLSATNAVNILVTSVI